ncbi:MAG TPA: zf-HC2 domain-containing protein [Pyrinomonadaceae bacterium]|nr:zf-HC2 domain-containing protein [Pyrinomonadaceae bacterium]
MEISKHNSEGEHIPAQVEAYLDGQLDVATTSQFEAHVAACQPCRMELNAQRQFLCELDSVLSAPKEFFIPKDFARIVSARAESDMRGVRTGGERRRALLVCLALGLTAFALLGAAAGTSLLVSAALLTNKVLGVLSLLWTTLHDVFIGTTIISRVIVRMLLPESPLKNFAMLTLLALAVASLSHLIISYHRRGQMRLSR